MLMFFYWMGWMDNCSDCIWENGTCVLVHILIWAWKWILILHPTANEMCQLVVWLEDEWPKFQKHKQHFKASSMNQKIAYGEQGNIKLNNTIYFPPSPCYVTEDLKKLYRERMREVEYLFRHINTVELEGLPGAWLLAHTPLCFHTVVLLYFDYCPSMR